MIKVKRVYGEPDKSDGFRILVDRLWPRGLGKNKVKIELWLKDVAPSDELRKWFAHDQKKWSGFKERYFKELNEKSEQIDLIIEKARRGLVTLLYGAKDEKFNNAIALKEYLETRTKRRNDIT